MDNYQLNEWFSSLKQELESAYIQHDEPWKQSGFSGPEDRWLALRKPIADCIDKPGSFLDIGCANGYLLECIMKWTGERGISITPYGLDLSEKLVELAKNKAGVGRNSTLGAIQELVGGKRLDARRGGVKNSVKYHRLAA